MTSVAPSLAVSSSSNDAPTGLDLLPLPADRSDIDVHGALEDDKVHYMERYSHYDNDYLHVVNYTHYFLISMDSNP